MLCWWGVGGVGWGGVTGIETSGAGKYGGGKIGNVHSVALNEDPFTLWKLHLGKWRKGESEAGGLDLCVPSKHT